jgi:hypothetical protein
MEVKKKSKVPFLFQPGPSTPPLEEYLLFFDKSGEFDIGKRV